MKGDESPVEVARRLDAIIQTMLKGTIPPLTDDEITWLCDTITPIFLAEPTLLELDGPINVCGDVHGQFKDLLRVFRAGHFTADTRYLFLGDYVDRGDQSLEVITLLFAMKVRYPDTVFLLRGNHESAEMAEDFGFATECAEKGHSAVVPAFGEVFRCLPLAAIVNRRILCIHGGLSPTLTSIDQIRAIERPIDIPGFGTLTDLLWSDPSPHTELWAPSPRGTTFTWGRSAVETFLRRNGLDLIMRAHQMADNGYGFPLAPDKTVVTVFTAPAYTKRFTNCGAFARIGNNSLIRFAVMLPAGPVITVKEDFPRLQEPPASQSECPEPGNGASVSTDNSV
jgi:serine/threonine-protein phosphatase PP1 catalytic subunit